MIHSRHHRLPWDILKFSSLTPVVDGYLWGLYLSLSYPGNWDCLPPWRYTMPLASVLVLRLR